MNSTQMAQAAAMIHDELRLKSLPVGLKLFASDPDWPDKTRLPLKHLKKRITICQAMTLARVYRWTVGLTAEDIVCVPARLAFGQTPAENPRRLLSSFFCRAGWSRDEASASREVAQMPFAEPGSIKAMALAPLSKGLFEPDCAVFYGNPAQIMRLVHGWSYAEGTTVQGSFGGKVECSEYLLAPVQSGEARVSIPGNGDRIMSMTQDEEMVFSLPAAGLEKLAQGLEQAGRSVGARYPVPFYQNFEPEFPQMFSELAEEAGIDH
mgnify:CR=1 FL=1